MFSFFLKENITPHLSKKPIGQISKRCVPKTVCLREKGKVVLKGVDAFHAFIPNQRFLYLYSKVAMQIRSSTHCGVFIPPSSKYIVLS